MPITVPAHQAAVLPLKLWRPRWFSGTALLIGSAAPDLEFLLRGVPYREWGHTVPGQFTFCLPLTALLVLLVTRVIAPTLAPHLPDLGPLRLRDYRLLRESSRRPGYWRLVPHSALLGSFSHVLWDGFTHPPAWMLSELGLHARVVTLGDWTMPLERALWYASALLGGWFVAQWLWRIGRDELLAEWLEESSGRPAPTADRMPTWGSHLCLWGFPAAFAAAGTLAALAIYPTPGQLWGEWYLQLTLLSGARYACLGLLVGCVLARAGMRPAPGSGEGGEPRITLSK